MLGPFFPLQWVNVILEPFYLLLFLYVQWVNVIIGTFNFLSLALLRGSEKKRKDNKIVV